MVKEALVQLLVREAREVGITRDEEFNSPPLPHSLARVTTQGFVEGRIVLEQRTHIFVPVQLEQRPRHGEAGPARMLKAASRLEHRVLQDRIETIVKVLSDTRRHIAKHDLILVLTCHTVGELSAIQCAIGGVVVLGQALHEAARRRCQRHH